MGTVDELLVEKFSAIFEDKFFPEIAPQNIVENDKCFCVFSLNSFQAARMNCYPYETYSYQFVMYHHTYDELMKWQKQFAKEAMKIGIIRNLQHGFEPVFRSYTLIIECDFIFKPNTLKGE